MQIIIKQNLNKKSIQKPIKEIIFENIYSNQNQSKLSIEIKRSLLDFLNI